jgi:hypothetical protein
MQRLVLLCTAVIGALASPLLLASDCAHACSCGAPAGTPQELVNYAESKSETVFAGEVVDSGNLGSPYRFSSETATVTLRVSKVWKGEAREKIEVTTVVDEASCGFPFQEGEEYLVYAPKNMEIALCGETKPLSIAGQDLEVLGAGEEPEGTDAPSKPEGEGNLPDTGGASTNFPYPIPVELIGAAVLTLAVVAAALSWRFLRRS